MVPDNSLCSIKMLYDEAGFKIENYCLTVVLILKLMKMKYFFLVYLALSSFLLANAQSGCETGIVKESLTVKSKILGKDINYTVYLPFDYYTSNRSYPVLYLLHGYTDNETSWIQFGEVNTIADKLIAAGKCPPMIIVMPDGGLTWYINNYNKSISYEDAFFTEFLPGIEETYRIRAEKEFRAIGGNSMGGYGSLLYAFKHPDMFAACLPFSAALLNDSIMLKRLRTGESNSNNCYGKLNGDILPESWKTNSVLELAATLPLSQVNSTNYYIDCGDKDKFVFGNSLLNFSLNDRQIPHEFRVRGGTHGWMYWRKSIEAGLLYLGPIFHR